jgi:hypothetical protein
MRAKEKGLVHEKNPFLVIFRGWEGGGSVCTSLSDKLTEKNIKYNTICLFNSTKTYLVCEKLKMFMHRTLSFIYFPDRGCSSRRTEYSRL